MVVCDLQPLGWPQQRQAGLQCCVRLSLPDGPLETWGWTEGEQRVTVGKPWHAALQVASEHTLTATSASPSSIPKSHCSFCLFFSISLLLLPSFLDTQTSNWTALKNEKKKKKKTTLTKR